MKFFFSFYRGWIGQDSQDVSNRIKEGSFVRRTMRSQHIRDRHEEPGRKPGPLSAGACCQEQGLSTFSGTKSVISASPMPLRGDLIDVDRATCSNLRVGEQDTVESELTARRREKKNKISKKCSPTLCFALLLQTRYPPPSRL